MEENREKAIYKVTLIGSAVNAVLIVLKFIAGIAGRSSAMVADAIHSLSDFATDVIVIAFVRISGKPRDKDHDYGHGKYETLATMIIGVILFIVGVGVCWDGADLVIQCIKGKVLPRPTWLALGVAIASIVLKEGLYHYTVVVGKNLQSSAVVANAWHHRSDAFSSLGTLIGIAGAMFMGEKWRILDPLAAVLVSFFIMKVAIDIIKPCISELLESSLPEDTEKEITDIIESVPNVSLTHNLRTRRIGSNIAIEAHVRMPGDTPLTESHAAASEIERRLRAKFGENTHISIHTEPIKYDCQTE